LPNTNDYRGGNGAYNNHSVAEITRSDASATNLSQTSAAIQKLLDRRGSIRIKQFA